MIPIERIGPIMLKYAKKQVPVCVHLDHGSDYEFVMRAVKVGFPSIMYGAVHFLLKRMLKKLHSSLNSHMLQITVEAELGIMASTDEDTHDDPEKRVLTNEDIREILHRTSRSKEFERTKCDALAVCFGTIRNHMLNHQYLI